MQKWYFGAGSLGRDRARGVPGQRNVIGGEVAIARGALGGRRQKKLPDMGD